MAKTNGTPLFPSYSEKGVQPTAEYWAQREKETALLEQARPYLKKMQRRRRISGAIQSIKDIGASGIRAGLQTVFQRRRGGDEAVVRQTAPAWQPPARRAKRWKPKTAKKSKYFINPFKGVTFFGSKR